MTDAVYVRLPRNMAVEVRTRAAASDKGTAEWVRDRIASSLRRPRPRAQRQGRAATPREILVMVSAQEMVATVGLTLERAARAEAASPRPNPPRTGFAQVVPISIEILRSASAVLVDLIAARRPS